MLPQDLPVRGNDEPTKQNVFVNLALSITQYTSNGKEWRCSCSSTEKIGAMPKAREKSRAQEGFLLLFLKRAGVRAEGDRLMSNEEDQKEDNILNV